MRRLFSSAAITFIMGTSATLACADKKRKVYMWGNGVYQSRPDALLQFKNFNPKLMTNLPQNLVLLRFGEYYEAGIDEKNNLYIWNRQDLDANKTDETIEYDSTRQNIKKIASKVIDVKFTKGFIWVLHQNNSVVQYPIVKKLNEEGEVISTTIGWSRTVKPFQGAIQIAAGNDHVLTLNAEGKVLVMGDDTYGQCGQGDATRPTSEPLIEKRIQTPVQVKGLPPIQKIYSNGNTCLALDKNGSLFGWGSNSSLQLSQQEEYCKLKSPLTICFSPVIFTRGLVNNRVIEAVAGGSFTFLITENLQTKGYVVFSAGNNLCGQMAIGDYCHVRDITRVQSFSNFTFKKNLKKETLKIQQMQCGKTHCIALLNNGYVVTWGGNEFGQLGNQKRSNLNSPAILKQFSQKNIVGVFAGENASGLILDE